MGMNVGCVFLQNIYYSDMIWWFCVVQYIISCKWDLIQLLMLIFHHSTLSNFSYNISIALKNIDIPRRTSCFRKWEKLLMRFFFHPISLPRDIETGLYSTMMINWHQQGQETPIYIWYENYPTHSGEGYEGRVSKVPADSPFGAASLNLTNIRESDQGWYECKVVFLNRSPNQHKNGTWYHLDVHAPPRFSVTPEDIIYVNLGEKITARNFDWIVIRWCCWLLVKDSRLLTPQRRRQHDANCCSLFLSVTFRRV